MNTDRLKFRNPVCFEQGVSLLPLTLLSLSILLPGCFENTTNVADSSNSTSTTTTTTTTTTAVPTGAKSARVIFRQAFPQGSFDASPASGTPAVPGSGQRAMRLFNPDGSMMASGGTASSSWPKWLTGVEIGISGASNSNALNPNCARFAAAGEDTATLCDWNGDGTADEPCGASPTLYRVSEADCVQAGALPNGTMTATGNGGPNDGVYVRFSVSRNTTYLGSGENLLVTLEYSASALNPAPANPSVCFTSGVFNPAATGCADQVWQLFLKHDATELVQPFMMVVPPAYAKVNQASNQSGSGIQTRQFFIPLAQDQNLSVIQLSRIIGDLGTKASAVCNPGSVSSPTAINSAHCVGLILYSMTIFRI